MIESIEYFYYFSNIVKSKNIICDFCTALSGI